MKISFDFDSTLSEEYIQELAKICIKGGANVYIITSRTLYPGVMEHKDLYKIAKTVGIPIENIHFTNSNMKLDKCEELGIDIHFDDMEDEIDNINRSSEICKGILVGFDISKVGYLLNNK